MTTYTINLDLNRYDTQVVLAAKQTDVGREIVVFLNESGVPVKLNEDHYAAIVARKPDGNEIVDDMIVDLVNNCLRYHTTEQMTAALGTVKCEAQIFGIEHEQIASPTFNITVRDTVYNDKNLTSTSEYNALNNLFNDLKRGLDNGDFNGATPIIRRTGWDVFEVSYDNGVTWANISADYGSRGIAYTPSSRYCTGIGSCVEQDIVLAKNVDGYSIYDIRHNAFNSDTIIESVIIPEGYEYIRDMAFAYCSSLKKVSLPDNMVLVSYGSFVDCKAMKTASLPNGLAGVGEAMFLRCTGLQKVYIPNDIPKLANNMFSGCTALKHIYFDGTSTQWEALLKGTNWDANTGAYTIHCTDGDFPKASTYGLRRPVEVETPEPDFEYGLRWEAAWEEAYLNGTLEEFRESEFI